MKRPKVKRPCRLSLNRGHIGQMPTQEKNIKKEIVKKILAFVKFNLNYEFRLVRGLGVGVNFG